EVRGNRDSSDIAGSGRRRGQGKVHAMRLAVLPAASAVNIHRGLASAYEVERCSRVVTSAAACTQIIAACLNYELDIGYTSRGGNPRPRYAQSELMHVTREAFQGRALAQNPGRCF